MGDATNIGILQGAPVQEAVNQVPANQTPANQTPANQTPANGQGHHTGAPEPAQPPPPGVSVPPVAEASPPEDRTPNVCPPTPTGLRDFEGRRLYFANVCGTVSPHALHCMFRSYGPIRTFHYDTTLHYGYVVYIERHHALLARYGIDGLILGSRAIRVYYPPFKPRYPTRYCYNCREMGHFIQSCPYTSYNNWEYNYSQMYNQGQPVIDHMNHPSAPMMQHYAGHMIPPTSQFMYPGTPINTMPGQPSGSATLMYQPGWPGAPTPNTPFMPPFMSPAQPPMHQGHPIIVPMPTYMTPAQQQQMHFNSQLVSPVPNPMQQPLIQNQTQAQQPQPQPNNIPPPQVNLMSPQQVNPMPPPQQVNIMPPAQQVNPMPPAQVNPMPSAQVNSMPSTQVNPMPSTQVNPIPSAQVNSLPSSQVNLMQPFINANNTVQLSATFPYPQTPVPQIHPNINAIVQEQATAIIQQHITPIVQQVVSQIMQDPTINSFQHSVMQQHNMDMPTQQSTSYTVNEEPETGSVQSGSMTMQHGSYTALEEPRSTSLPPQTILAQLMQSLPMQDSDSEYMDFGKMMQFAAQALLQDQCGSKNEDPCQKETCSRQHCVHEVEDETVSMKPRSRSPPPMNCCPVHNTPLTKVQKPENTPAQQSTAASTINTNESTTAPNPQQQQPQHPAENVPPADPGFPTRNTSPTESFQPSAAEQPAQSVDNQYFPQFPCQPSFALPSSIFFTLPPIVVNITSPVVYPSPAASTVEQKATFPPPYDTIQKNVPENYDFMQENERNFQEFEEVVRDDEQNFADNERDLQAQQDIMMSAPILDQPNVSGGPSSPNSPRPPPKKAPFGKKTMKIIRDPEQIENDTDTSIMVCEQTPQMSERERQLQDRLKLRAMLTEQNDQSISVEDDPVNLEGEASGGNQKLIYSELITTMNSSCSEIENLFSNLSSLVGNPLAKKCLDQIRTKSETDILRLSQQLLHKIVDNEKASDKEEILKLSNDLLLYANQKLPSTSVEAPCEGAVGGVRNLNDVVESSHSDCDSRKEDSDDGNYRRKSHWKKNKKRRR